jgi:hypothetical protein
MPDHSYASLDAIEDELRGLAAPDTMAFVEDWATQLGAVCIANTGARWVRGATPRCLTGFPELGRARLYPAERVQTAIRTRSTGYLRDTAEAHDIALRRARLAELVATADEQLEQLQADIHRLTGTRPDLQPRAAFLAACEGALRALFEQEAPRDERRQVRERVVLALGEEVRRELGAEWSIQTGAKHAEIGQLTIANWSPISLVRNVAPGRPDGLLERNLSRGLTRRVERWREKVDRGLPLDVIARQEGVTVEVVAGATARRARQ